MFPVVRTVDEMGFFGKRTSVLFAGGLFGFCFWGLWYLVAHNKTLQGINDNTTFFLLAALLIYAACAVCLCVATVLGSIVKTLRTRRSESSNRTIIR
ncbi:MAG: hypothetical protein NTX52_04425, partial [Planctomycetota bacterium]|nr:hypothetical protein [Planctomycetota bacterium]